MDSQLAQIAVAGAHELTRTVRQVASTLELFAEGNTLPFVARYRKEATGGLDETQLRAIQERSEYLRQLGDRRAAARKSDEEQSRLAPELGTPRDAGLVRGSPRASPADRAEYPIRLTNPGMAPTCPLIQSTDVFEVIRRHVLGE